MPDGLDDIITAAIATLRSQRNAAISQANAASAGQSRAPAILEQASQLEDRANALRDQYKDISTDLLKAFNQTLKRGSPPDAREKKPTRSSRSYLKGPNVNQRLAVFSVRSNIA